VAISTLTSLYEQPLMQFQPLADSPFLQIQNPSNQYGTNQKSIAIGDYSFEAKQDGKYTCCFSNEHWSANSKEVSFKVHGIVYVSEQDAPSDPLEKGGEDQLSSPSSYY
jgi:emp24/gp25L/p24 family/GOLD